MAGPQTSAKDDVEIIVEIRRNTQAPNKTGAILAFDGENEIWIPNSLIREREAIKGHPGNWRVVVPGWFAEKEGIV